MLQLAAAAILLFGGARRGESELNYVADTSRDHTS